MTDAHAGKPGGEAGQQPSIMDKLALLMKVRRHPDGTPWRREDTPWRGATALRDGLANLPGGGVNVSVSMAAKVINGKQSNPGHELRAGLAELFEVPVEYFLEPVSERIRNLASSVHEDLTVLAAAGTVPADSDDPAPEAAEALEHSWTTVLSDLTQGVRKVADALAAELDMPASYAEALLHLVGSDRTSMSITEMADVCEVTRDRASRIADALEERSLLRRCQREPGDSAKVRRMEITDEAREIVTQRSRPQEFGQAFLGSMSGDDMTAALTVLGILMSPSGDERPGEHSAAGDQEPLRPGSAKGVA